MIIAARPGLGSCAALLALAASAGCADLVGADFDDARPRKEVAGQPCGPTQPFEPPRWLPLNDQLVEAWAPRLTADQLTMHFASNGDEYVATRARTDEEFANPTLVASLNSADADMAPSVTGDGLEIFLERGAVGAPVYIYAASRDSPEASFSTPARLAGIAAEDAAASDVQPYIEPEGRALYFASNRASGSGWDLYRSERERRGGPFSAPRRLDAASTLVEELFPVVSPDELTLYFASNRNSAGARGAMDVFIARRGDKHDDFGAATPLVEVNSADNEYPSWISADGCTLYLTRLNPNRAIYVAARGGG